MAYPRAGCARELSDAGVGALLSLAIDGPPADVAQSGIVVRHEPVPDFTPPDPATLARCVDFVRSRWDAGSAVVVHCVAGLGRTGTVLAACLVATGVDPLDAIRTVRRERPGSIETPEQEEAIFQFAKNAKTSWRARPS
jgi:atypical dual specificity phosphatase